MFRSLPATVRFKVVALESMKPRFWLGMLWVKTRNVSDHKSKLVNHA